MNKIHSERLHANIEQPLANLSLSSKWYADEATLVAATILALEAHLHVVESYSKWSGTRLNIPKCRLTGYMHILQNIKTKKTATWHYKPA
jgi:hypothetical protein